MVVYYLACTVIALFSIHTTLPSQPLLDQFKNSHYQCPPVELVDDSITFEEKEYTFAVYIAARNNLARFVAKNLMQMMQVGTNDNLTILVHLDSMLKDNTMISQRFIIYKNKIVQVGELTPMDSGNPATLIDFCQWAFTHFPSRQPMLTLWSHGIGDLELSEWIRTLILPELNSHHSGHHNTHNALSVLEYLALLDQSSCLSRGICFDDSTGHSLTNHEVGKALEHICQTCLNGKPLACLLCDACLMNSIGFVFSVKPHGKKPVAELLIGSQEAVLATGYDYHTLLTPLSSGSMAPSAFAEHVTKIFAATYSPIIRYYTQSALELSLLDPLYTAIDAIAHSLIEALHAQHEHSVETFIDTCSSRTHCTSFAEPSYKDMHHLFSNMHTRIPDIVLHDSEHTHILKKRLADELQTACALIKQIVIANAVGDKHKHASGISIYLPKKVSRVHHSYQDTDFGKQSVWYELLKTYLKIPHHEVEYSGC